MKIKTHIAGIAILAAVGGLNPCWSEPDGSDPGQTPVAQTTPTPEATTPPAPPALSPEEMRAQAMQQVAEGRELQKKGFSESAIVCYRKAIELDPSFAQAYEELGKILLDTKNQAFAITIYSKLAELQPDNQQWKDILSDLYVAYDMPREAIKVDEDLLAMNPTDLELMRKLVGLYKNAGLNEEEAAMLCRVAQTSGLAKDEFAAGESELGRGGAGKALPFYESATKKEPENLEYQDGYGKALISAGRASAAVEHYEQLLAKNPAAKGIKDRLGEARIAFGDKLVAGGRYVAARKNYEAAQGMGASVIDGDSLAERVAKSRRLNRVNLHNTLDTGRSSDNYYVWNQSTISVPLQEEDLAIQVLDDYRNCASPNFGVNGVNTVAAGARYRPNENYEFTALGGTNQFFNVAGKYQDDHMTAGVKIHRDIWFLTSRAIFDRYRSTTVEGYVDYQPLSWVSVHGDAGYANFDDGLRGLTYNLGTTLLPINTPGEFIWSFGYDHGGVQYNRESDPTLIFSPLNFQADSFGTEIQHWLGRDFKYTLGYYYSVIKNNPVNGPNGSTFLIGADAQLGEGSYFHARYEYGNFASGRVNPGFIQDSNNYRYYGEFQFTF